MVAYCSLHVKVLIQAYIYYISTTKWDVCMLLLSDCSQCETLYLTFTHLWWLNFIFFEQMPKYQKMPVFRPPSWISRGVPHKRVFSNFDMLYRIFWNFYLCFVSLQFTSGYPFCQRRALARLADSSVGLCLMHLRSPNTLKTCHFKLCLQLYFAIQHWFSYM